ncbi:glycoside hydrolase superfamily [Artemisia annua]|uniref:Glycoside hydrolase superfamily n=1 Tax=Artemisia annua TaxID=35608 RepID=A0A2U1M2C4_ARTAN|nr:glycoside hydrolase superfamily [Artemisia annua]
MAQATFETSSASIYPTVGPEMDKAIGHGYRNDLFKMVADLKPGFIRFPGKSLRNAFWWKSTIGPWEERPGHLNDVRYYWTDDGLRYSEYLQVAEDLSASPIWDLANERQSIRPTLDLWFSYLLPIDVLDGIDLSRGDPKSTWGSVRVDMGHTKPFGMEKNRLDFEVDETSLEYRALHPLAAPAQQSSVKELFEPIEEDEDQSVSDAEDDQPSDDEPANGKSKDGKKSRAPSGLYEVKDERHAEAFNNRKSLAKEDALPLEERVKALSNSESSNCFNKVKAGQEDREKFHLYLEAKRSMRPMIRVMKMTTHVKKEGSDEDDDLREKRRGIQSLGLKSNSWFHGRAPI